MSWVKAHKSMNIVKNIKEQGVVSSIALKTHQSSLLEILGNSMNIVKNIKEHRGGVLGFSEDSPIFTS